jgi:hypothetical protein
MCLAVVVAVVVREWPTGDQWRSESLGGEGNTQWLCSWKLSMCTVAGLVLRARH